MTYLDLTPHDKKANMGPALQEATDFLHAILANGPLPATAVQLEARNAGISKRTLDRAKAALPVRSKKTGTGPQPVWRWSLPTTPATSSAPQP